MSSLFAETYLQGKLSSFIWKNCLEPCPNILEPEGHGWKSENGNLLVDWMSDAPAPDTVLELLSCTCARSCSNDSCICLTNGLKCTDMCRLKNCFNMADDNDVEFDSDDEYDDSGESESDCD